MRTAKKDDGTFHCERVKQRNVFLVWLWHLPCIRNVSFDRHGEESTARWLGRANARSVEEVEESIGALVAFNVGWCMQHGLRALIEGS
jgi:hypothetical protein